MASFHFQRPEDAGETDRLDQSAREAWCSEGPDKTVPVGPLLEWNWHLNVRRVCPEELFPLRSFSCSRQSWDLTSWRSHWVKQARRRSTSPNHFAIRAPVNLSCYYRGSRGISPLLGWKNTPSTLLGSEGATEDQERDTSMPDMHPG